ncbi:MULTISPECIES: DNA cytosine methyltransferase [unclassified Treponema]|uniref:DNA cytosine methyltransferase n=1 Tax=unclassified Treponema TaxID=2638727 RepID=UPI0020A30DAB|nr:MULTISPECIES: DNA cytosine methyltransferase [unclassified Treponema]UTC67284.1 DNA cytosine methyltransferase [Treponema sp. OMZ 789]UTC70012.1 DNA cytosine methyltransferase [Treponema sp. OMZ 790]UTC72728.1 DNA cytosine methyltransferase [Treponema sp. OMZ 791]
MTFTAIDLFSGVGGLTEGLRQAGFQTKYAFEIDEVASRSYSMNHKEVEVITKDIRQVDMNEIKASLKDEKIHLLAGCPPCQGFSAIRRLNKPNPVADDRNNLIDEYVRFIKELNPFTFMMENVPGLALSSNFEQAVKELKDIGYVVYYKTVNVKDYGVPQNRKRLVMVGSRLGPIEIAKPSNKKVTVKEKIGSLPKPEESSDKLHKIYPKHTKRIQDLIRDIPHDGGSRKDLGESRQLECHKKANVGFNDVYGRLRWNDYSTTITGGCLNPSKGRFLHPEQDRCISAREAALLQSFPRNYKFPTDVPISKIALMIGNALPPQFCKIQALNIKRHLKKYLSN